MAYIRCIHCDQSVRQIAGDRWVHWGGESACFTTTATPRDVIREEASRPHVTPDLPLQIPAGMVEAIRRATLRDCNDFVAPDDFLGPYWGRVNQPRMSWWRRLRGGV